jgi:hypothetical protein
MKFGIQSPPMILARAVSVDSLQMAMDQCSAFPLPVRHYLVSMVFYESPKKGNAVTSVDV